MFDWLNNLLLAKELARRRDEAAQRCAIGRAYYAVFCTARNRWIMENGPIPLDLNVHHFVWSEYQQAGRLREFIGKDGFLLLRLRNRADYDNEFADLDVAVQRALVIAEKTLNNLDKLTL